MRTLIFIASTIVALSSLAQSFQNFDTSVLEEDLGKLNTRINQTGKEKPTDVQILQNRMAELLIRQGDYSQAEKILNTLLTSVTSHFIQGMTRANLGLLYLSQGRSTMAVETLKSALMDFENSGESRSLEAARCLSILGQVYWSTDKQVLAEQQLLMALNIRQRLVKEDHELIAATYNDLGLIYSQSNTDKALEYYEEALATYTRLHGTDHPKIAIAHSNIGYIYLSDKLYGDAVNYFETALKIWEKVYSQPHPTKAFVLFNLGDTYHKMGDSKTSADFFNRALKMYRASYGEKHPDIANVLNAMGAIEIQHGKYNESIALYQQALQANTSDFSPAKESTNPQLTDFYNGKILLYSLLMKARSFEERHFGKSLKFSEFDVALNTLQLCDSLIDLLRQQISNESDKMALGVIATDVYADGVRIAHEASQLALNKRKYLELAFYFAEKSKSAVLLEAISESDAKSFAGIPATLLEEERTIKVELALTAQKLAQKPSPDEEKKLRETAFTYHQQYEKFVKKLEVEFPGYFDLKFNTVSPSIIELQKTLDASTALLSYFIDESRSRLYIFMITRNNFRVIDHHLPDQFPKYITGFRNGLYYNAQEPYVKASNFLSKFLIPKLHGSVSNLIILPTGRLGVIPFEALFYNTATPTKQYNELPYLVKKYSIQYEFSAGLLLHKRKNTMQKPQSIFLCAPVQFPPKDNLGTLPGTETEVYSISNLFSSKNLQVDVMIKNEATELAVKKKDLKQYGILHFATHGVVDEKHPELSRIFLQEGEASEDGNLFTGEIYNLEMDADLVTLSACQTGLGKISKGEGVIGLSRALVYAGAKNVIVSFWSVADESTSRLMQDFYSKLLTSSIGRGLYASHLRSAKLNMINSKDYGAPYYWAPFILIGF